MELALQVVGLKMTGKIEDAKNVAMRIVGTPNQDSLSDVDSSQMMNVAASSPTSIDPRRLLLSGASDGDYEKLIVDFLSVLDVAVDAENALPVSSSISHQTCSGQTLLHLATFLKFSSLVDFLVRHEIDLDARDNNGYTALHCAALIGSHACARVLLNAGADADIVDARGRTAAEVSSIGFFQSLSRNIDSGSASDDEAEWGDAEEDSEDEIVPSRTQSRALARRRVRRPASRRTSKPSSLAASDASEDEDQFRYAEGLDDDDTATVVSPDSLTQDTAKDIDEKQVAASFAEYFQRAWAQFQPPHLMPQMPQLPGVPAWVFPVFVPMPAWPALPAFRGEKRMGEAPGSGEKDVDGELPTPNTEWRAYLERWTAQMTAFANDQRVSATTIPVVPAEVPSMLEADTVKAPAPAAEPESPPVPAPTASRSLLRRFGYGSVQMTDQEVNAFVYRPKRSRTLMKKGASFAS